MGDPIFATYLVEAIVNNSVHSLDDCFLGPKGEQRAFVRDMISLVLDDYIFWRKNYYPKDPPGVLYRTLQEKTSVEFRERFIQELSWLTSDLKLEVPFFSPRYFAHIVSEVSLPGVIAYFATLLYNPNNVSSEASAVTTRYELEVGEQFADLFQFDVKRAFGHLTSGGTIANYEALWYARVAKFLPLSMASALKTNRSPLPAELSRSVWELLNVPHAELEALFEVFEAKAIQLGLDAGTLLRENSIAQLGERGFEERIRQQFGEGYREPVVLLPSMAHYCWNRALGVLGLGRKNICNLSTDEQTRVDPHSFQAALVKCASEKRPVLLSIGVAGNTEFGAIDPIDELVTARNAVISKGIYSPLHIDAAFGGYFACMFKKGAHSALPSENLIPRRVQTAFSAISQCESVTIDPHKMGYVPYGAGAVVHKHGFLKEFVTEPAPYALDGIAEVSSPHLGQYIMEGSKPGAAAASVWFTHRMIPLNTDGFGAQLFSLCELAHKFYQKMEALRSSSVHVELVPLFPPETNVLAFVVMPTGAKGLSAVNRLTRQVYQRFGVREVASIQSYDYLVSHTRVSVDSPLLNHPVLRTLDRAMETSLEIVRIVIMNRWLSGNTSSGAPYIDDFLALAYREAEELVFSV